MLLQFGGMVLKKIQFLKLFLIAVAYLCGVGEAADGLCAECRIELNSVVVAAAIVSGKYLNMIAL